MQLFHSDSTLTLSKSIMYRMFSHVDMPLLCSCGSLVRSLDGLHTCDDCDVYNNSMMAHHLGDIVLKCREGPLHHIRDEITRICIVGFFYLWALNHNNEHALMLPNLPSATQHHISNMKSHIHRPLGLQSRQVLWGINLLDTWNYMKATTIVISNSHFSWLEFKCT